MSGDEGVTYTRDVVVDEHWRPGSMIPERDLRETIDTVTVESSPNADDIERDDEPVDLLREAEERGRPTENRWDRMREWLGEPVASVWEVDDCECGWSSGHRDTCLCGSVAADVVGETDPDPGRMSR